MPRPNGSRSNHSVRRFEKFGRGVRPYGRSRRNLLAELHRGHGSRRTLGRLQSGHASRLNFYSEEVDWTSFEQKGKWKRRLYAARALSWALLRKLSPARRVLLLLTIAFLIFTLISGEGGSATIIVTVALLLLLALELADRVTMKRDLEIAREIQRWLVPELPPSLEGIDIAFATRPANTVSGDYYDAFRRDETAGNSRLFLVVADVAGKSIPAALLMATIQTSLRDDRPLMYCTSLEGAK